MSGDLWLEKFLASGFHTLERTCFITLHESGVAHHIGGENCGQAPFHEDPRFQ